MVKFLTWMMTYNKMKICWRYVFKHQHCVKQQNLYIYYSYMDDKLDEAIFRIIYLGSHKYLQTEHPHRSFHILCGFLFNTVQRSESNAFSVHQLQSQSQ